MAAESMQARGGTGSCKHPTLFEAPAPLFRGQSSNIAQLMGPINEATRNPHPSGSRVNTSPAASQSNWSPPRRPKIVVAHAACSAAHSILTILGVNSPPARAAPSAGGLLAFFLDRNGTSDSIVDSDRRGGPGVILSLGAAGANDVPALMRLIP